jgi:hypothetical protein
MEQLDNTPITPPSSQAPGLAGWFQVWIRVVTKPSEQTFLEITEHPDAQPRTAYIWMFIVGTLSGIVSAIVQAVNMAKTLGDQSPFGGATLGVVIGAVCGAPILGALSVLIFALGVAIIQWIAKLFGGTGTYDKLVYAVAAISVPFTMVSVVLLPLSLVPYVGICTGFFSMGLSLYALFLQITAVKAVNRLGWLQASGSVLLPGFIVFVLCACVMVIGFALLGPMLGDVIKNISQGLPFAP